MKNKEVKQVIEDIATKYPLSEIEQGALAIASSKMTSPWVRTAYRVPTKPGLYICAVRPKNANNQMTYVVDIYNYGIPQEKGDPEYMHGAFYKWDSKYSCCLYPDVIAWMPIPYFYNNKFKPKTKDQVQNSTINNFSNLLSPFKQFKNIMNDEEQK